MLSLHECSGGAWLESSLGGNGLAGGAGATLGHVVGVFCTTVEPVFRSVLWVPVPLRCSDSVYFAAKFLVSSCGWISSGQGASGALPDKLFIEEFSGVQSGTLRAERPHCVIMNAGQQAIHSPLIFLIMFAFFIGSSAEWLSSSSSAKRMVKLVGMSTVSASRFPW